MEVGIVSYGAYLPRYRITPQEIGRVWGTDGEQMSKNLLILSKSVPSPDEDVITISIEAARNMLRRCEVNPQDIGAIYVGSESHPYAVKPTGTVVAEAIGAGPNLTVADYEFACKAGTAAIQTCMGLVGSGMIKYGVAIGADTSQGAPGDALEFSASAGGAAYLIGSEKVIARINKTCSYTTDTPDFWRREGQCYPSHGGRFTGEPAYFKHILAAAKNLFGVMGTKPTDYQYAVFHQPNGKFPVRVAKQLGFTEQQIEVGLLTPFIGNTYSGAVPLGLASVLDVAEPGQRIFAVAYGSGAGSDAFDITVTDEIKELRRERAPTVKELVERKKFLDYATYAKYRGKIRMKEGAE
ncbi:MAG: hydroxymethylglutaryl-CoA synthase [Methanomassiliicoccus sp.]|jgi:hydroxymethylglutaryl-CoA synthase|nr:hydroxymethylglutaryl-CoA synthase [Methanomassiliicoccus sp.]